VASLKIKSKASSTEKEKPSIIEEPSVASNLIPAVMKLDSKPTHEEILPN
jgi:hypothetical protein